MPVILGMLLIVATASAVAQSGPSGLPDAPGYSIQLAAGYRAPPLAPWLSLSRANNFSNPPLTFSGTEFAGTHRDAEGKASGASTCGHGAADKTEGSGWVDSILGATSKGGHYCALGEGGFWKRGSYAMSRAFAAHKYDNLNSFTDPTEFFAPGMTSASGGYNPYLSYAYQYDPGQRLATRYASAVGRETLRNMLREFWPDISSHMLKRRP